MRDGSGDGDGDRDGDTPRIGRPARHAAGVTGVAVGLKRGIADMGPVRAARVLARLNQAGGVDCPGCAWPEPQHRHIAEFCENGAKAVAEEATTRTVGPDFFARHGLDDLATRTDHWLGRQGRLTHPMVRRPDSDHYVEIGWDEAYALVAEHLTARRPDRAVFYTSGRTSNEAAFLYQLLARAYGTNNLPDCSNMCHESSGRALVETIGVGKGSVTLDDIHAADLILVVGQNPGTNHPRMLTALETAKRGGARIVAVNPLPEAGLINFRNPQTVRGVLGRGTDLADEFLQIRLGGDQALFQALGALLLDAERAAPGTVVDRGFVAEFTEGYAEYAAHAAALDRAAVATATGLRWADIERVAGMLARSERTIVCWAMGLTQHRHSVPTIREIVNLLLLRGMIGKPGAGVCPVRGHSNVQGDRTMGIVESPRPDFLDALDAEFSMASPREHGYDTVDAIRAMRDGAADVFVGMGGNFAAATPDTAVVEAALRSCELTVQVSTKLNRSHVVAGRTALILPCLGRTERDVQATGEQVVTVEDSMSVVHSSRGRLAPASPALRSEVAIVCGLGRALGLDGLPWDEFEADYSTIRARVERVVPGFERFEERVAAGGFTLPHPPRDSRVFPTPSGRARFTANALTVLVVPPGRLLLQTLRSHDQYNTTVYGLEDRYRGVSGGRRVVLVHPDDVAALGFTDGARVDLISEFAGTERRAAGFRVVAYPTAQGCAAAYFPETNALVPLDSTAEESNTPTSKSVVIRLEPAAGPATSG